jgi:5'-nucleotidase/UDP-sugar diphosphatase
MRRGASASAQAQAALVIGDSFKRKDSAGACGSPWPMPTALRWLPSWHPMPGVKVVTPDAAATQTLSTFASQVTAQKAITIGTASEALCLVRVPGGSNSRNAGVAGCETANTLARGSDVAQVVAEAFLRGQQARRLCPAERGWRARAGAGRHAEHEHRLHACCPSPTCWSSST